MNYSGAIVIQGQSDYVNELKKAWSGNSLIWSTWIGNESKYNKEDIVVFNEMPSVRGVGNVMLQQKTTLNGILKAKELKYERVLKWRSDMIPTNTDEFVKLFLLNAINMFFFHDSGDYYVDYIMEGETDKIYDMWNFTNINVWCAEIALTNNIRKKQLNKNIEFFGKNLNNVNDVLWLKKQIKLYLLCLQTIK